jgi:hypothetical protein
MRLALLFVALLVLTHCSSVSQYDANSDHSNSSLIGSQGGAGVQAPIWSDDPSKKTVTNQNAGQ